MIGATNMTDTELETILRSIDPDTTSRNDAFDRAYDALPPTRKAQFVDRIRTHLPAAYDDWARARTL